MDRGQKRDITLKEHEVDIEVMDKRIDKELKSLCGVVVDTFLKKLGPSIWVPPDYVMLNNYKFLTFEYHPMEMATQAFLFHNLYVYDGNEIEKIIGCGTSWYVIINCVLNFSYCRLQVYLQHI